MTDTVATRSYRPGDWFGIFGAHGSVLLPASEKGRVAALWELVDADAGFDELLDALIASGLRALPGFVLLSNGDEQTRVVLRGTARATFTLADGEVVELDGGAAATWVERTLEGVDSLVLEVAEVAAEEDLPIDGGLVRVARVDQPPYVEYEEEAEEPVAQIAVIEEPVLEEPLVDEPVVDQPAVEAPAAAVDPLTEPIEMAPEPAVGPPPAFSPQFPPPPPPLPPPPAPGFGFGPPSPAPEPAPAYDLADIDHDGHTVAGGWDPSKFARQHPGIPGQPPAPSVTAVPVARLVFSSGETVEVDRAVLIGRAPEARRFTSTEQPRLVTVPSPNQEISSTHLEVRPGSGADHGSAVVTDMGSTNGTVLQLPGLAPEDLQPGIAVQLIPGSVIDLGDGVTIQVTHP